MLMLITNTLRIELDPLHGEEEGSGNVPTVELSPQNAIMRGYLEIVVMSIPRLHEIIIDFHLTFVKHFGGIQ